MSIKTLKQTGLAVLAVATISIGTSLISSTPAQAVGLMPIAPLTQLQTTDAAGLAETVGYRRSYRRHGHSHRHGRRYNRRHYYSDCYYKRRKVWSEYHYRYIWKRVRVCY